MLSCFSILLVLVVNVNSRPKKNYYLVDTVGKGYTCNIIYLFIHKSLLQIHNPGLEVGKSKMTSLSLKRVSIPLPQKLFKLRTQNQLSMMIMRMISLKN